MKENLELGSSERGKSKFDSGLLQWGERDLGIEPTAF
jgi:hypothetical protein